jgi:integrase
VPTAAAAVREQHQPSRTFGYVKFPLEGDRTDRDANLAFFHRIRSSYLDTFATVLLVSGTHPKVVQEMLGHANIPQTMDAYSHVLPDMQDRAISAMESALR